MWRIYAFLTDIVCVLTVTVGFDPLSEAAREGYGVEAEGKRRHATREGNRRRGKKTEQAIRNTQTVGGTANRHSMAMALEIFGSEKNCSCDRHITCGWSRKSWGPD